MSCPCGLPGHPELVGVPYDPSTVLRPCWLYANDPRYRGIFAARPTPPQVTASPQQTAREWPRLARWLARRKRPGEKGLGDTVARYAGRLGGEAFRRWYQRITGHDCGCGDRQARLNALYPYAAPHGAA